MNPIYVDYFRSMYVIEHISIMRLLDDAMIATASERVARMNIHDPVEKRHQEALLLWEWVTIDVSDMVIAMCDRWTAGADDEKKNNADTDVAPDNTCGTEHVRICPDMRRKGRDREIVEPILMCSQDRAYSQTLFPGLDDKIYVEKCRHVLVLIANSSPAVACYETYPKGTLDFSRAFSHVFHYNRIRYRQIYVDLTYAIYRILCQTGIFEEYPTFRDGMDLSAHIMMMNKSHIQNVIDHDMSHVHVMISKKEWHPVWSMYIKDM